MIRMSAGCGVDRLECLLSTPIDAIVPFAVAIFAVRRATPADPVRTGAVAGFVAGGVSVMAYTLHRTDSLPFRCGLVRRGGRSIRVAAVALVKSLAPRLHVSVSL